MTSNYTYDVLYQLTQVAQGATTTESYSYDPVGNRLSSLGVALYSYNSSNELTSTSNASNGYDNNGNTVSNHTLFVVRTAPNLSLFRTAKSVVRRRGDLGGAPPLAVPKGFHKIIPAWCPRVSFSKPGVP